MHRIPCRYCTLLKPVDIERIGIWINVRVTVETIRGNNDPGVFWNCEFQVFEGVVFCTFSQDDRYRRIFP